MASQTDGFRPIFRVLACFAALEVVAFLISSEHATGVHFAYPMLWHLGIFLIAFLPFAIWHASTFLRVEVTQVSYPPTSQWRLRGIVLGIILAGLAMSVWGYRQAARSIEHETQADFERLTERLTTESQRRLSRISNALRGMRGLFQASESVRREQFRSYFANRNLAVEYPAAKGFGFIQRVQRNDIEKFEIAEREDNAAAFSVKTYSVDSAVSEASDLFVVKFIVPFVPNRNAWGLDIGSEPIRRAATLQAIRSGVPTLTPRIQLAQDEIKRPGFLYMLAVYKNGSEPGSDLERENAALGVVYAAFVPEEAMGDIADVAENFLDFRLYEGTTIASDTLIFDSSASAVSPSLVSSQSARRSSESQALFQATNSFVIGGHTFTITSSTSPTFEAAVDTRSPFMIAAGGIVLSLLLAGMIWSLGQSRGKALALAQGMTADLLAAQSASEQALHESEHDRNVLAFLASGGSLTDVLTKLVLGYEAFFPGMIGSVLLLDSNTRRLRHCVAPSLPLDYCKAIDGVAIGPDVGSCGTAAHSGKTTIVSDISTDTLWCNFKSLAISHQLHACWSIPIFDLSNNVLGTLAFYFKTPREPLPSELAILERGAKVAGLAISRHQAEERLKSTNDELSEARNAADAANKAKSEFLANMSHEIRTPLTSILGFAELLREDGNLSTAPEQRIATIDTIRNSGTHLLTVINDILDLSKIEADRMSVERIETSLPKILHEVFSLMHPRAVGKGITLHAQLLSPIPEQMTSDPTRLRQILLNLVGNAIKFTESGGVEIVSSVQDSNGQSRLIIDIIDSGTGLTESQSHQLFAPFGQADTTVTRKHGGTGLGLTISRRLAALMGGNVILHRTEPGKGSCFRIDLPLESMPGATMISRLDAVEVHTTPKPAVPVSLKGRILLAEDGVDNQRLIAFHLAKAGAVVEVAENGKIALEMLETAARNGTPFDLLLTDMQMPEMDGYALARTLRSRGANLPIVALTAHAMAEDRAKCIDAGCDDYTSKPIDKVVLLTTCAAWMNGTATRPVLEVA